MSKRKTGESMSKIMRFMKKQGYYILLGLCALLVVTIITLSIVFTRPQGPSDPTINSGDDNNDPEDPNQGGDPGDDIAKFYAPTTGVAEVVSGEYIGTLNTKCYGVMFEAKKGDKVFAAGDGVVLENVLKGGKQKLTIAYGEHKLIVDYYGLDAADAKTSALKAGSAITKNSVIGTATGRYNYGGSFFEKVHIDVYKLTANNVKGERVTDFSAMEFEVAEK